VEFQTSSSWVFEFELELSVTRLKSSPRVPVTRRRVTWTRRRVGLHRRVTDNSNSKRQLDDYEPSYLCTDNDGSNGDGHHLKCRVAAVKHADHAISSAGRFRHDNTVQQQAQQWDVGHIGVGNVVFEETICLLQ